MKIDAVKLLLERKDININAITKIKQEKLNRRVELNQKSFIHGNTKNLVTK